MRRVLIMVTMLILATVACFSSGDDPTDVPVRQNITTVTRPPTFIATVTVSGQNIFLTPTTSGVFGPALPPSSCPAPAGWQAYTVRAGDTLAVLAAAVGSTTDILQVNNCLSDPNSIFVGQTLYLPTLPSVVPTAVATSATTQCPIPAGWQPYTVRSGDSLTVLALSIGSTAQTIQNGNCITNPDAIFVGQILYLPNLPANAPTAIVTAVQTPVPDNNTAVPNTLPTFNQLLRISPTQARSDGASVTTQRTVSLDVGVVANADNVRYFAGTSATDQNPVQVGIDNNPFDGTRINYTLNEFDEELFFIAVAENEAGFVSSNIVRLVYDPDFNAATGAPVIQPFVSFNNDIYVLQANTAVNVLWPNAPQNALRVEFYYQPTGSNTPQMMGTDSTPGNGSLIGWTVPANISGEVYGRAVFDGRTEDSDRVTIVSQ